MLAVIAIFALLVGATATFAVRNAQDEQQKKEAEAAAASTETSTTAPSSSSTATATTSSGTASTAGTSSTSSTQAAKGPGGTVKIAADPSGQLKFTQASVSSKPGAVKIDFTNQSPVGHDVKVEDSSGSQLGGTVLVTGGSASATVSLAPGTYTFYCDVPGHREAGMEGTLTVK
jgi:plastocyanin